MPDYSSAAEDFLNMDADDVGETDATKARLAALRNLQGVGLLGMAPGLHSEKQGKEITDVADTGIKQAYQYGPEARLLKLSLGQGAAAVKGNVAQQNNDAKTYGIDIKDKEFYSKLAQAKLLAGQHEAAATERTRLSTFAGDKADKAGESFYNDLSPYKNPKLNVLQTNIDRGDVVDQLLKQGPGGLTQAQQAEAAQGIARLIGGSGRIAQQQIEHMIPHTLWQDAQKLWEYLSNNPQILKNKNFVDIMQGTLNRERALAQQKIYDEQEHVIQSGAHSTYIRSHLDDAARTAQMFGHQLPDFYGHTAPPQGAPPPAVAPQARPPMPPQGAPPQGVPPMQPPPQAIPPGPVPPQQMPPQQPPQAPPQGGPLLKQSLGAGQQGPVRINSKAEYDALPPGTKYIGPSGKLATKPMR